MRLREVPGKNLPWEVLELRRMVIFFWDNTSIRDRRWRSLSWFPKAQAAKSSPCCQACCWMYVAYVCVSWLLFTFLSIESTTDHCPEIPASHAPPPPKPKPKSKKAPLPPKNAIAASATTSHKSNEAPHAKKKGKAPAKQPPLPPPKPTSHSANREAGEYCTGSASYGGCMCMGVLGLVSRSLLPL